MTKFRLSDEPPRKLSFLVGTALCLSLLMHSGLSRAEPMREILMSCTYGVLAGTLVGAATLAFTEQPGENLNRVAKGASLGLYAGILLGVYVAYFVPGMEEETDLYNQPVVPEVNRSPPRSQNSLALKLQKPPSLYFRPTLDNNHKWDGAMAMARVYSF